MALDIAGIDNSTEYYSHHYLDALLESDLRPLLSRWAAREEEGGPRAPWKALNALSGRWSQAFTDAQEAGPNAPGPRLEAARGFHALWLEALGYVRAPGVVLLDTGETVPLAHQVEVDGKPRLWVIEAPFPAQEDDDPLDVAPAAAQLPEGLRGVAKLPDRSWRELLDKDLFRQERSPRFVLVLAGATAVLADARKWGQGKSLGFDLDALYARRQAVAWQAVAGLLHADVLCPAEGPTLLDTLEENSHKHAFAVSTDLRYGAQRAVELIANEVVWYRANVAKKALYGDDELAGRLTRESLAWLYRLLFLFYVEARGAELDVVPMKAEAYRLGYSLETLRDLELVPLTTDAARNGYYLHHSLEQLFDLVNRGFGDDAQQKVGGHGVFGFSLPGMRAQLFDPTRTPLLRSVKLRNFVLQEVLQLLSLSREGHRKQRGRISYAQLGINQLGAVYEGLLSYSGFFAQEDLCEVRAAGASRAAKRRRAPVDEEAEEGEGDDAPEERETATAKGDDERTWFVPARQVELYDDDEVVRSEGYRRLVHPRGTFLFRLAGRNREKSASYYTPEVLTRCLAKYTLKERLGTWTAEDRSGVSPDDLLKLTVCEPAMGSGAFLNEAINQLAAAYLERKQIELGTTIPPEDYPLQLQAVKAHFAANSCYGVDLNPLAAELGRVSLWLNTLRPRARAHWYGLRIQSGNSLVARGGRCSPPTSSRSRAGRRTGPTGSSWPPPRPGRRGRRTLCTTSCSPTSAWRPSTATRSSARWSPTRSRASRRGERSCASR